MIGEVYTLWLREMKRYTRARSRVLSSIATPFFWLAIVGVGFSSFIQYQNMSYLTFMAPGIVGITILFTSVISGISVIWDRQFGFLKEILVAPVSRMSIFLGKTIGSVTIAMINGILVLALATVIAQLPVGPGILLALVFMFFASFALVSVGLIIASHMKSMEGFQAIFSFLIMPLFFLSGALFPLDKAPQWMQYISYMDPLRFGVDGLRGSLIGINILPLWLDLAALAVFSLVLFLIGSYSFKKSTIA